MITAEVIMRLFFNRSIEVVVQLGGFSLFIVTLLAAAWVLRERSHIVVDFAVGNLKEHRRQAVNVVMWLFATVLSAFLFYLSVLYVGSIWARGEVTSYPLMLPKTPLVMVMVVGWAFLTVEFAIQAWEQIRAFRNKDQY